MFLEISKTPVIAFRADHVSDTSPASNQIMIYTKVRQNDGNGYDSTTGIFTAPKAGLYLFMVQVYPYTKKTFEYKLVQGDTTLFSGRAYSYDWLSTSSTTFAHLNSGEKVCVRSVSSSSVDILYSREYNAFSGVFIRK